MNRADNSLVHIAAAAALVLAFVVLVFVVATSLGGSSSSGGTNHAGGGKSSKPTLRTYTVKPGDNLSAISAKYKVPPDVLKQLNPKLDPQALVPGQQVKLR